jgi:toxin YoeB
VEVAYTSKALDDIEYWKKKNDSKTLFRISKVIISIQESPYKGLGKPEPLKYKYTGLWSRRINKQHRIVYQAFATYVLVYSLKGHYED